jgi:hypothetical protein
MMDLTDSNLLAGYKIMRGKRWRFRSEVTRLLTEEQNKTGAKLYVPVAVEKLCDVREVVLTKPSSIWSLDLDAAIEKSFKERMYTIIEEARTPAGRAFNRSIRL